MRRENTSVSESTAMTAASQRVCHVTELKNSSWMTMNKRGDALRGRSCGRRGNLAEMGVKHKYS